MTARHMPQRVGHGENSQAERQRDADKANAKPRHSGRQHGTAAAPEDQPKGTKKLCDTTLGKGHLNYSRRIWFRRTPVHLTKWMSLCSTVAAV